MDLSTLIELKLVAGRFKDLDDVIELIRFNLLDESFAQRLTPRVRDRYIHCLEQIHLEDKWEETQDRAFEDFVRQRTSPTDRAQADSEGRTTFQ